MTEEKLTDEIKEHLASFPDRQKNMQEKIDSLEKYKDRVNTLLVTSILLIFSIGVWVGTMQITTFHSQTDLEKQETKYSQYETRLGALEINNGEIKTRLASIETTLQEIKVAIKAIR